MKTKRRASKKVAKPAPKKNNLIRAWQDDPQSGLNYQQRPVPDLSAAPYPARIQGNAPAPRAYNPGTSQFRYWTAAEALRRGSDFWGGILGGRPWQPGPVLPIFLDEGDELNAYYDRVGLRFFHGAVGSKVVFSGESPDVVCHEMGHGILDSFRPELWDAASAEIAAFHESFGDMSAIVCALQLPSVRKAVLQETNSKPYRSSSLSRLAEQLGWAIRQFRPDRVDPDCLRNAVNSFFYASPESLPPDAPASHLSSEAHSFSRVFTTGFYGTLANMLARDGASPTEEQLQQVSIDAAKLLADAILASPVVPNYYSQIAGHMIESDKIMFNGKYHDAIAGGFVHCGVLSIPSMRAVTAAQPKPAVARLAVAAEAGAGNTATARARTAAVVENVASREMPHISISGDDYGLLGQRVLLRAASAQRRLPAVPAAFTGESMPEMASEAAARAFLEDLFQRGHVDFEHPANLHGMAPHPTAKKTHALVRTPEGLALSRKFFDCGCN